MRRVVITGIGTISAVGLDPSEFWSALLRGCSGITPLVAVDSSELRFKCGAQVRGFDPLLHFDVRATDLLDRATQFAIVAARQAVADAGLGSPGEWSEAAAVITGTASGGIVTEDATYRDAYAAKCARPHPFTIPKVMANASASQISMEFGVTGPAYTISTACASSTHAIGLAFQHIRAGLVDVALAGGTESPFAPVFLRAWDGLRVVAPETCRPFSADRNGMVLGEGAAILVLEDAARAAARGARVYAELRGLGMSADAHHITQPTVAGPARAMARALDDAGMSPADVDYVNAHGTGTAANDPVECRAIRQVFGAEADRLAVSSTKSMHGHALGAAGALEAAATALTVWTQHVPPTANFTRPDPACDLDTVPNVARRTRVSGALSNSFAFGGLNAVLAFRRWPPDES